MGATKIKVEKEKVEPKAVAGKEQVSASKKEKEKKLRGKNYKSAYLKVDRSKYYTADEAVALAKEISYSKFVGSLELHAVLNKEVSVDIELPNGTGKEKKIEVASEKTLEKLAKNVIDFDVLLATPEMMPKLVSYARLLGPKGLMPNPKNGTVIANPKDADKFSGNKIKVKTEKKAPVIHISFGKADMENEKLVGNLEAILNTLGKNRLVKAFISPSMGPSIKLSL